MANQNEQGTEQATPFKLREAQKRGSVAKSAEVNSFVALAVLAAVVAFWGKSIALEQLAIARQILEFAGRLDFSPPHVVEWLERVASASFMTLVPLFFLLVAAAILAGLMQTGPIFTAQPLKPDFDRVNPFSGLMRIFSLRTLVELCKSLLKLVLLGGILYVVLKNSLLESSALNQLDPHGLLPFILDRAAHVIFALLPILAFVAAADFIYTRWDYLNRMKMTRKEMRDELKQREGDPRIRARIRELRQEMLKRSKSLKRVKDADVLVTNPSHLAIALLYKKGEMSAPQVIAKGAGELAARMRLMAQRNGVPIVRNPGLARAMFRTADLDRAIPDTLFPQVARLLAWVYALRTGRERG